MNEIEKIEVIKKEELDEREYFKSLTNKAYEKGLIGNDEIMRVQVDILELLKIRTQKYNGFDSSSILKDKAQIIMESNIYTIGLYLKKFKPDDAIEEFKKSDLKELYNKGRELIDRKLNISRILFNKVINNKIITKNEFYNLTIIDGIKGFFKIYDPDFEAQNIKITADYPTYNNLIGKLDGIEFIEEYLKSIYYENKFCKKFNDNNIEYLLEGYSKDYKELLINIFEIVLLGSIGCSLANENIMQLTISENGIKSIYDKLTNKTKEDIYTIIFKEYCKVIKILFNEEKELQIYIEKNISQIQYMIQSAIENKTLDKLFIMQKYIF